MMRKVWFVLIAAALLAAAAMPVSCAKSWAGVGGIEPYQGIVGADSPLYGLKLFLQKIEVSLEGNDSARLQKHLALGRERLAEACAVALDNNAGALDAALTEYEHNIEAVNTTMDDEDIDDITYLEAGDELQDQEDVIANMTNTTDVPSEISDLYSRTLNRASAIKNGRPFICCNNTSYFIPPGQMKKIANGATGKTPGGLSKKGYVTPEPLFVEGTVVWPWDEGYDQLVSSMGNATATDDNPMYLSNAKGKSWKIKGNGKGKK